MLRHIKERTLQPQPRTTESVNRQPFSVINENRPPTDAWLNSRIERVLNNPKITNGTQLGTELAKVLFTEEEMAASNLTGRRVHGHTRATLDPAKMKLLENLVKEKFKLSEAEFCGTSTDIRGALSNRCKYLRLKYGPTRQELI